MKIKKWNGAPEGYVALYLVLELSLLWKSFTRLLNLSKRRLKIYIIHKYHHHSELLISMKKKTSNLCVYCNTHCNSLRKYGMEMCETFINAVHKFSHSDFSFFLRNRFFFVLWTSFLSRQQKVKISYAKKKWENWQFGVKWAAGDVKSEFEAIAWHEAIPVNFQLRLICHFLFNRFSLPQTLSLFLFFNNFDEWLLPFAHSLEMSYAINEEMSLLSYFSLDYWLHFYWHPRDLNWLL